jgi:hypothetical protein
MPYFLSHHLYEMPYLYVPQLALTIWMLVDANRRGVDQYWFWIILVFQPIGAWAYFFMYKVRDFRAGKFSLGSLFQRRASLEELRYRVDRAPTVAHRLELADRLIESGMSAEAIPHLQAVLAHEPEHGHALFALARCHREQGHPAQAVHLLEKLIARHAGWGNYSGWRALIEARQEGGDARAAVAGCRDLLRASPTLEHKCLLAEHLIGVDEKEEARKLLQQALEDYSYTSGPSRSRDRRWASQAKQIMKQL